MKKKAKRIIISVTAAFLLFVYYNYDYKYVPQYEIVGEVNNHTKPYAKYRHGNVYIISSLDEIDNVNENDVIILDQRDIPNSNMKIISSHLIRDKEARNDILEIIMKYENENPSKWNRTIETMRIEWFVHNFLYFFDYQRDRTTDVDLDNNDEKKYQDSILQLILKM